MPGHKPIGRYVSKIGGKKTVLKKKNKKMSNHVTLQFLRSRIPYLTIPPHMFGLSFSHPEVFVGFHIFAVRAVDIGTIWGNWCEEKCPYQIRAGDLPKISWFSMKFSLIFYSFEPGVTSLTFLCSKTDGLCVSLWFLVYVQPFSAFSVF